MDQAKSDSKSFHSSAEPINRVQQNVLARGERWLLDRLCARMPRWVTPDILTFTGVFGALAIFTGYAASTLGDAWLWLAIAGFVIHWFGDSLDGSLARFRRIERPRYGYFLDHSCDGLATTLVVLGLGASDYVQLEVALVALAGYLLMSIHAFLCVRVMGELRLSYMMAGPTELRLVLIAMTLSMLALGPNPIVHVFTGFDLFVGAVGTLLIVLFGVRTAVTARKLAIEEPPPKSG